MTDVEIEIEEQDGVSIGIEADDGSTLVWGDGTWKCVMPPHPTEGYRVTYDGPIIVTTFPDGGVVLEVRRGCNFVMERSFDEPPYDVDGYLK